MGIRILLAGIVGGAVIFVCSAAAHMATPLGHMGFSRLPSEEAILSSMKQSIPESGMYFFPGIDMTQKPTAEEQREWEARLQAGPSGLLIFKAGGGEAMSVTQLAREALANMAAALLAALIAVRVAGGYVSRLLAVALIGPITWLSISASYWNWYGFPREYVVAEFIMESACWLIAAFFIAGIARAKAVLIEDQPPAYDVAT